MPLVIPTHIAEMGHAGALYQAAALDMLKAMVREGEGDAAVLLLGDEDKLHRALMAMLSEDSNL